MYKSIYFSILLAMIFSGCKTTESGNNTNDIEKNSKQSIEDDILNKCILAHGGEKYKTAKYSFEFRKKQYSFRNNGDQYEYKVSSTKDGVTSINTLNNLGLTRVVNGKKLSLDEKQINGFSGALNSVIYFATLPYKLQDAAVNKKYIGETTIKDKPYHILQITFDEVGGGKDHDDQFYYWINKDNFQIDYLAYNYQVNNGGVRFRSAYNPRKIDGVIFQDYVNYKAEVGTPLADLPKLFEQDQLKKLSLIETEKVRQIQ